MKSDGMRFKPRDRDLFGSDSWELLYEGFRLDKVAEVASVFSQGNGFVGMRGGFDEPVSDNPWDGRDAVFLNGSYEYEEIKYAWRRYGLPERAQVMLRIPDWHYVLLKIGGQRVRMTEGRVIASSRRFNLRDGVLTRSLDWEAPDGAMIRLQSSRFVSMTRPACAALQYSVTPLTADVDVSLEFPLDGDVRNLFSDAKFLSVEEAGGEGNEQHVALTARKSGVRVAVAVRIDSSYPVETRVEDEAVRTSLTCRLSKGQRLTVHKIAGMAMEEGGASPLEAARGTARTAAADGWNRLLEEHRAWWEERWNDMDIEIEGDDPIQQGIRFSMMQLLQHVGRDGYSNIGAKGMTGYNYAGKTFWDTEMYMAPFFLNTDPQIARALIDFRYHTLDKARDHAKELGYAGALFPWETINGEESAFIFEASTAQYHLQAAVGLAIRRYHAVTGDWDYVRERGLEILVETSRVLYSIGAFVPTREGAFCINMVCGPDEYTPCVDNNCYTNVMTKHHFLYTVAMLGRLKEENPETHTDLSARMALYEDEPERWREAAEKMYIPYSDELGVYLQNDQFLYRTPMKVEDYLAAPIHKEFPLNQWRLQLLKQADVVLLEAVRPLDFDKEQKRRDYEFYEPKTIHDSSLSPCCYSIVARELGIEEQADPYLCYTVRLDLDNYQRTGDGLHAPGMGGAWWCLVQGVAGLVIQDERLDFDPRLPKEWKGLRLKYRFAASQVDIEIRPDRVRWTLMSGPGFEFSFQGERQTISREQPAWESECGELQPSSSA